jgi:phosphoribosylamine--glycine ligase/phosphoribosylformylglycinamidine cyclo-ligase
LLPKPDIGSGDILIGLPSSGVHSNGYSLVRHVVAKEGLSYTSPCPFDQQQSLGHALLTPTRIYVRQLLPLVRKGLVKAMAHITGGGFIDNIPRILPKDMAAHMDANTWPLLDVFKWLKKAGNISDGANIDIFVHMLILFLDEMARTFNCGLGMILIVAQENADAVCKALKDHLEVCYQVGHLKPIDPSAPQQVFVHGTDVAWK